MPTQKIEENATAATPKIDYRRNEDFFGEYANNIKLDSSNWDLKLTFGELNMSEGPNVVDQKFSTTIPWAQAKVLHYFLSLHLFGQEEDYGRIVIPTGIIPPWPSTMPAGFNPEAWKRGQKLYEEFMAANPEAAPKK